MKPCRSLCDVLFEAVADFRDIVTHEVGPMHDPILFYVAKWIIIHCVDLALQSDLEEEEKKKKLQTKETVYSDSISVLRNSHQ